MILRLHCKKWVGHHRVATKKGGIATDFKYCSSPNSTVAKLKSSPCFACSHKLAIMASKCRSRGQKRKETSSHSEADELRHVEIFIKATVELQVFAQLRKHLHYQMDNKRVRLLSSYRVSGMTMSIIKQNDILTAMDHGL